jgi:hypothetical protein
MKKLITQYRLLALLLVFTGLASFGQVFEKTRSLSRSFALGPDTEIQVLNKYGDIELISWDKDSVKFEIEVKVVSNKESKATTAFEYIDFDFKSTAHYIIAKTSFAGQGTFWSEIKDLASTVFTGSTTTHIDYKIFLPANAVIKIDHKYGNIFISDYDGPLEIKLSNGDLKAYALSGKTKINMQFANANINKIDDGELTLGYYSELQLEETRKLRIDSRSSRLTIDNADKLRVKSNRDKYFIGQVSELNATTDFSYFEIGELGKSARIDANYGDVVIQNLTDEVSEIDLSGTSTDISISRKKELAIKLEVVYNEKAGIYFDDELKDKKTLKEDEKNKLVKTVGLLGESGSTPIKLKIKVLSGEFHIYDK